MIPVAHDEMIALGGDENKTAEIRIWNKKIQDYVWTDVTKKIKGMENIGKPIEYNSVVPTYCISSLDDDNMPDFPSTSNFIFGNELMPFMMEITFQHLIKFFPAPMRFQQKTGQIGYRVDKDIIIFLGGCDATMTLVSKKAFRYSITDKTVARMGNLETGRYFSTVCQLGVKFNFILIFFNLFKDLIFVCGGVTIHKETKKKEILSSCEVLDLRSGEFSALPDMPSPRYGHFCWSSPSQNKIYVAGGRSVLKGNPLSSIDCYNLSTSSWESAGSKININVLRNSGQATFWSNYLRSK